MHAYIKYRKANIKHFLVDGRVFAAKRRAPFSCLGTCIFHQRRALFRRLDHCGEPCEVSEISFHSLRHSAVTLLKAAGVSDFIAREIVGHDSAAVSRQYFASFHRALAKRDAESAGRDGIEAQKRFRFLNAE
jgi:integrase